jgi:hypothetical protein
MFPLSFRLVLASHTTITFSVDRSNYSSIYPTCFNPKSPLHYSFLLPFFFKLLLTREYMFHGHQSLIWLFHFKSKTMSRFKLSPFNRAQIWRVWKSCGLCGSWNQWHIHPTYNVAPRININIQGSMTVAILVDQYQIWITLLRRRSLWKSKVVVGIK